MPETTATEESTLHCAECGAAMKIDGAGVSCHLTPDGNTDHDADADHVALDDSQYGGL